VRCLNHISDSLISSSGTPIEFVNIREQCAWAHKDNHTGATYKAIEIILSGIAKAKAALPLSKEERPVESSALVLGTGLSGLAAASALVSQGFSIALVSGMETKSQKKKSAKYIEMQANLQKQLENQGIRIMSWPQSLELSGSPGNYEAVLRYPSQTSHIKAGALITDLAAIDQEMLTAAKESLLSRILARKSSSNGANIDSTAIREFTIKETAGIFIISLDGKEPPEEQVVKGTAAGARASAFLAQGMLSPRASAVIIDSKLCRGCGDCAAICPYIEMKVDSNGTACAYVDQALCLGCGACIARCPTGAIVQHSQSDKQIISALESLLKISYSVSGVR
jgi:heterodisulfide reductase subunit A-like polyferredoxin